MQYTHKIDEIVAKHKDQAGPCIEMLHEVQNELGYVPFEAMEKIAEATGSSPAEVYGVVMFYAQFTTEPKGKHVINVCLGTACYVKGSQGVIDKFQEILKIKPGQTTEDGLFTLDALRCIGACGIAPALSINGKVYPKMTVSQVKDVIGEYLIAEEKMKEGAAV